MVSTIDLKISGLQLGKFRIGTDPLRQAFQASLAVSWHKRNKKWYAQVRDNDGHNKHLGYFNDPFSAAWARDEFVKATRGEFAVTNELTDRRMKQLPFAVERRAKPHLYVAA